MMYIYIEFFNVKLLSSIWNGRNQTFVQSQCTQYMSDDVDRTVHRVLSPRLVWFIQVVTLPLLLIPVFVSHCPRTE